MKHHKMFMVAAMPLGFMLAMGLSVTAVAADEVLTENEETNPPTEEVSELAEAVETVDGTAEQSEDDAEAGEDTEASEEDEDIDELAQSVPEDETPAPANAISYKSMRIVEKGNIPSTGLDLRDYSEADNGDYAFKA